MTRNRTRSRNRAAGTLWCATGALVVAAALVVAPNASAAPARPAAGPSLAGPGYVAITPQRIVDTRTGLGNGFGPVPAGQTLHVALPAVVPGDATGVVLTVTADQFGDEGYVTAYPCGGDLPLASLLNPQPSEARSNQLLLALDSTREVCLYTRTTVHMIVDLTGWLSPSGQLLHPVTQVRALDTRFGPRPDGGDGKPGENAVLQIPLAGHNGIAANATGVAANITMTNPDEAGYVTAYPCGADAPDTSTGNVPVGGTRAAFTFVGLGSGSLCVLTRHPADLIVDVTGYFGPGGGVPVQPATPRRLYDSRDDDAGLLPAQTERVTRLGLPTGSTTAALNITAVNGDDPGWVRLAPCGSQADTSSLNHDNGTAIANLAMTAVGDENSVCVTANVSTHVIVDLAAADTQGNVAELAVDGLTLFPAFRPDIRDYVVRCAAGSNVFGVALAAEPGATVRLDGGAAGSSVATSLSLQPGQGFSAEYVGPAGDVTYRVRCLPPDFPPYTTSRPGTPASAFYLIAPPAGTGGYVAVFDPNGVPVWWYFDASGAMDAKLLANPTRIVYSNATPGLPFNTNATKDYQVRTLDGALVGQLAFSGGSPTDYHDMQVLANGDHLMLSYVPRLHVDLSAIGEGTDRAVVDAHIQEITPGGTVVFEWHSEDHIAVTETVDHVSFAYPNVGTVFDLVHVNAISSDDAGGFIVSARHTDAVFRIDQATGAVTWKLGGTPNTSTATVKNLTFVNDPLHTKMQHDARLLADGTMTLFDNHSNTGLPPRAVRYQLNVAAGTATKLEQIDEPDISGSPFQGNARRTAAGTWVVNWGGSTTTTEQAANSAILFRISFATAVPYRSVPVAPSELTRDQLAAGMDVQHPR